MKDPIYGEGRVSTVGNMTVTDVTHRPKRMQGDSLKKESPVQDREVDALSDTPNAITLESAIRYYEEHAEGEFKVLYTRTAQWLDSLRKVRIKKIEETIEHVQSLVHGTTTEEGKKES
jgi:hypothetical protein